MGKEAFGRATANSGGAMQEQFPVPDGGGTEGARTAQSTKEPFVRLRASDATGGRVPIKSPINAYA